MTAKREYLDYLQDILSMIEKIEGFTSGLSEDDFEENEMAQFAVIRAIEVMGEAAKNVPADVKERYSEIPWNRMAGMRDKLIHRYFGVDLQIVWETASRRIPELRLKISEVLIREQESDR